jgi:excisionase family DNA binding protein
MLDPATDARPLMIDKRELGRQLSVGETTVKKMIRCGKLPLRRYRLCRKWLFSRVELQEWIEAGCPPASRWSMVRELNTASRRAVG